jgi:hypothetical protein
MLWESGQVPGLKFLIVPMKLGYKSRALANSLKQSLRNSISRRQGGSWRTIQAKFRIQRVNLEVDRGNLYSGQTRPNSQQVPDTPKGTYKKNSVPWYLATDEYMHCKHARLL